MTKTKYNEHNLQALCVKWFRIYYKQIAKLLFAVPNGTKYGVQNRFAYHNYLQAEGVTPGVADLILLKGNSKYNSLCIELKKGKNKQQQNQIDWQKLVEENGSLYSVVYNITDFQNLVNDYLQDKI